MQVYNLLKETNSHLWHITDKSNLASIQTQGILSRKIIKEKEIKATFGGNDISLEADLWSGMDQYVHLAFSQRHPFAYIASRNGNIHTPYWVKIDRRILLLPGVVFTKGVSNKSGEPLLNDNEAFESIDFEAIFTRIEDKDRWKEAQKSEVLVPNAVPPNYIL